MGRSFNLKLPFTLRKNGHLFLALSWSLGLLTGILFSLSAGNPLVSLMRTAAFGRVSILGLLTAILLPFLLSALAVCLQLPWLFFPISFGKAFLAAFLGCALVSAYGTAGILVRFLLMFSECFSLPFLFWYWIRYISLRNRPSALAAPIVFLFLVLIGIFDFYFVSPFLAAVIS